MRPEVSAAVARAGDQWQLSCHPQSLYLRHKRVSSNRYLEQKSLGCGDRCGALALG